jgi:dTDP-4-amino-4,6-dideoxygalactose transaminase
MYDRLFSESGLEVAGSSRYPLQRWEAAGAPANGTRGNGALDLYFPAVSTDRHIFNQYVIRVAQREPLRAALRQKGIGTEVYYPVPLHLQECFAYLGHKVGAFPESESAAQETLALPVHPELTAEQARYVVDCIREFFAPDAS